MGESISLSVKWKPAELEEIVRTSCEINRSGWLSEEGVEDEERRSAEGKEMGTDVKYRLQWQLGATQVAGCAAEL